MTTIALLIHPGRHQARKIADDTMSWLSQRGIKGRRLALGAADRMVEGEVERPTDEVDLSGVDLAVSLGGDGTFLRLVPLACRFGVPLLGVNFGRLGYLLDTPPDRVSDAIDRFLRGETEVQDRALLDVTVTGELTSFGSPVTERERIAERKGSVAPRCQWKVLNEVVLEKTVPGHTVHLLVSLDGTPMSMYRADGVLVATPTGSTAYNLSAGGPVLSPLLRAAVVTPIAPHRSMGSSMVLASNYEIKLEVAEGRPAVLVLDGLPVGLLEPDSAVTCKLAPEPARLVRYHTRPLAVRIREVLAPGQPAT